MSNIPIKLIIQEPDAPLREMRFDDKKVLKIGRGERKGVDVPLNDAGVARVHAAINIRKEDDVSVMDMGGTGTIVDGKSAGAKGKINNGSCIEVGRTLITVYLGADALVEGIPQPAAPEATAPPPAPASSPTAQAAFASPQAAFASPQAAFASPQAGWGASFAEEGGSLSGDAMESFPVGDEQIVESHSVAQAPAGSYAMDAAPSMSFAPTTSTPTFSPTASAPTFSSAAPMTPQPLTASQPALTPAPQAPLTTPAPLSAAPAFTPVPLAPSSSPLMTASGAFASTEQTPFASNLMPSPNPWAQGLFPGHYEPHETYGVLGPAPTPIPEQFPPISLDMLLEITQRLNQETWAVYINPNL